MNKEQTISYLREALRLETDINTQRRSMNWMEKRINSLAIPNRITKEVITPPSHDLAGIITWIVFLICAPLTPLFIFLLFQSKGAAIIAGIIVVCFFGAPTTVTGGIIVETIKENRDAPIRYNYKVECA